MKSKSVLRTLSVSGTSGRSTRPLTAAVLGSALSLAALPACSSDEADDDGGMGGAGSGGVSAGKGGGAKGGSAGNAGGSGGKSTNGGTAGSASAGTSGVGGGSGGGSAGKGAGGAPVAGSSGAGGSGASGTAGTSGSSGGAGSGSGGNATNGGESGNDGQSGADDGGSAGETGGTTGTSGSGGSGGSSGSGGKSGGAVDPFGIREIYPTAPGGAEWDSEHWEGEDYEISGRSDPNDPSGLSGMRGDGTLEVNDGVLTMSGSQPRIYIYEPDSAPWRDVEVTAYYQRVTDSDTAYAGLVIGVRSGADGHTDSNACDAHTYYARIRNDGAFDFEKELEHPASSTQARVQPDDAWPPDGEVPRNTWIGFKFVIYNLGNTGNVKFEAYRDMTNGEDGGDWELVNETVDDGGWFVDTSCSEHDPDNGESDMIVTDGGTTFIRNTDVDEARYRWVSVREIDAP